MSGAERRRLEEDARRARNWKRWGPYLSERQWGTVREDYSPHGECWDHFSHDQARSRAYRWGEDGLLGICDRECRLCFALALWNGRDPILKERLFGLTGPEGNHGEDVKECYYYLDSTPTHSYMRALYKYPQAEYPYAALVSENRRRGRGESELELLDTGVFDGDRYFDVFAEYAKASPDDVLIRITAANRGPEAAAIHVLPTLWFRNTWSPERTGDGYARKPSIVRAGEAEILAEHESLGRFRLAAAPGPGGAAPELLFTENETNFARLFGVAGAAPWVKDAFHDRVIGGRPAVNPAGRGTKAAACYRLEVPAGGEATVQLRLFADGEHDGPHAARFGIPAYEFALGDVNPPVHACLPPGDRVAVAGRAVRGGVGALARRHAGGAPRGARPLPRAAARSPRRRRSRPHLGDRGRRAAAHPARLPVSGLVGRRGAAPGSGRAGRSARRRGMIRLRSPCAGPRCAGRGSSGCRG